METISIAILYSERRNIYLVLRDSDPTRLRYRLENESMQTVAILDNVSPARFYEAKQSLEAICHPKELIPV